MKVIQMSKLYAVRRGRKTGIFNTWNECKKQTHGYSNAKYKSFKTIEEANAYLNGKNVDCEPMNYYVGFDTAHYFNRNWNDKDCIRALKDMADYDQPKIDNFKQLGE